MPYSESWSSLKQLTVNMVPITTVATLYTWWDPSLTQALSELVKTNSDYVIT